MTVATIGQILKEARTKKALSHEEIHSKIKIHPRVLQILEEGRLEKLPSPLFAKNFIKSYAEYLGLNTAEILEAYDKEEKKDPEQILFIKTVDERQEAQRLNKSLIFLPAILAVAVAAVLLFVFIRQGVPVFQGWMKKNTAQTSTAKPAKKQQAPVKAAPKKSSDWVRSVDQGNFPNISKKSLLDLRLRALDNVWVRVTGDGKTLYQGILIRGAAQTWSAKEGFEIWTGNASNMYLTLNKYALASPGKGMVKKMLITREGVRIPQSS